MPLSLLEEKMPHLADYFLIASYSPMFLFGMIAFSWKHQPRWLSLPLVMEATVLTFGAPRFEGIRALACTVGAGTMVLTMLTAVRVPRSVTWLGAVSYPLYLVHQNIGLLAIRETLPLSPVLRVPDRLSELTPGFRSPDPLLGRIPLSEESYASRRTCTRRIDVDSRIVVCEG